MAKGTGKRTAISIRASADSSSARTETFNGREYTVVPVIALVEGVIQSMNSPQPELALASEFGRFVAGWNGRPLVMSHPVVNGVPVSANDPQVLEDYQIGMLFNTVLEDGKLKTEAWIDNVRAQELNDDSRAAYESLTAGEVVEVSTGLFTNVAAVSGLYNNQQYEGIWEGIVPDHLAILPAGIIGACSVEDGCGANRVNSASGSAASPEAGTSSGPVSGSAPTLSPLSRDNAWRTYTAVPKTSSCDCGCGGKCGGNSVSDHNHHNNEATPTPSTTTTTEPQINNGFLARLMSSIMGKPVTEEDVARANVKPEFDPARILANSIPSGMMFGDARQLISQALGEQNGGYAYVYGMTNDKVIYESYDYSSGTYVYFQRSYTVSEDGASVSLGDDIERVNLITQIVPVVNAGTDVTGITANANASAPEGSEEETAMAGENATGNEAPATTTTTTTTTTPVEQPNANATSGVKSLQDYLSTAPTEVREMLESGMRLHAQKKAGLIKSLQDTGRCKFNAEQLNAMSVETLEQMAELANVPSYAGQAVAQPIAANAGNFRDNEGPPPAPLAFPVKQAS